MTTTFFEAVTSAAYVVTTTSFIDLAGFQADILWMLILGFVVAFILAFAVGANDVANSFGTTVGAKTLTLFQACILASIFETLGAILLGAKVGETIRKGIIDPSIYDGQSELLMAGEVSAMIGSCLWQLLATFLKLPVSGTHSIVGATLGFSLVAMGAEGVNWRKMALIVGSWFISPILSGGMAALFYILLKRLIFSKDDPVPPSFIALPILYGITIAVNFFSVLVSGAPMLGFDKIGIGWDFGIAIVFGLVVAVIVRCFVVKIMKKSIEKMREDELSNRLLEGEQKVETARKPVAVAPSATLGTIPEKREILTDSSGSVGPKSTSNLSEKSVEVECLPKPPSYEQVTCETNGNAKKISFHCSQEMPRTQAEAKARRKHLNQGRSKSMTTPHHSSNIRIPLVLQLEKQVLRSNVPDPTVQQIRSTIRKNFSEPAMVDLVDQTEGEVFEVFINRNRHAVTIHRKKGKKRTESNSSGSSLNSISNSHARFISDSLGKGDSIHYPVLEEPFDDSEDDEGLTLKQDCAKSDLCETAEVPYTAAIEEGFRRLSETQQDTIEIKVGVNGAAVDVERNDTVPVEDNEDKMEVCKIFSFLQILTACFGAFAHGGNDVSNAIGPLIALYIIYSDGVVDQKTATPIWLLLYGGLGICVGLWVWGRRVIKTMGEDITALTPSRGFVIELMSALTVLGASNVGIPVSTTHCKVGAVVAVGWVRSRTAVDWKIFRNIVLAWFVTVPVSGGLSALVFVIMRACTGY